jgi:hypothetical protein
MIPLRGTPPIENSLQIGYFTRLENTGEMPISGPFRGQSGPTRGHPTLSDGLV